MRNNTIKLSALKLKHISNDCIRLEIIQNKKVRLRYDSYTKEKCL